MLVHGIIDQFPPTFTRKYDEINFTFVQKLEEILTRNQSRSL